MAKKNYRIPEEKMTVEIDVDEIGSVECEVITILEVDKKDYIALLYQPKGGTVEDSEVWFYGYSENPDDPNEEPELIYIDNDDDYDKVADAFEEFLDDQEFDEM